MLRIFWPGWHRRSLKASGTKLQQLRRRLAFDHLEDRLVPSHTVSVSVVSPPATFFEGVAVNLTSTVTGATGTPTFAWSVLKDGASFTTGSTADFSFTPDDNASYAVSLTVTDGVEAVTDSSTVLTVANQVPTAGVSGPTSGAQGQALTFTLTATDAAADATAGFTFNIDWNSDGSTDETVAATANNGTGVSVSHAFTQPGPNTFRVTAIDKDGGTTPVTHTVTVVNGAAVVNGTLFVSGTSGDDNIQIIPKGKPSAQNATVRVFINGVNKGTFTGVNAISVFALEGNDRVHLAGSIKVSATIDGGTGNDRLKGGAGRDLLLGGDGNDWLNGHRGADVLIGGAGSDRLLGGPGDDLLIAGTTAYDADSAALAALLAAWSGPGSYLQRVQALLNPAASVHLSADGTGATVLDDGAPDRLTGAAGKDWFFATQGSDKVTGLQGFEFVNGTKGSKKNAAGGHGKGPKHK